MTKARSSADFAAGGFFAGKNKIINGDFNIWQRGTSFTITPGSPIYTADRFVNAGAASAGSLVVSRQTFTAGTAPVAGYEGTYFLRYTMATTTTSWECFQKIEDVRAFAGQTMTVSFWAKSSSAQGLKLLIQQNFGSGGSGSVNQTATLSNLSTSWTRYTATFTMASISGKTIGTNSHLLIDIYNDASITGSSTIDIWGVQVENGSTATAFQTATGTIQGELAACQRYYYRVVNPAQSGSNIGISTYGSAATTGFVGVTVPHPVTMRVAPTSVDFSSSLVVSPDELNSSIAVSGVALSGFSNSNNLSVLLTVSGATQYRPYRLYGSGSTTYLGFSAEL